MFLGYNTNGFAHHRLDDALAILADLGYAGVALTLDYHTFDPFQTYAGQRANALRKRLDALGLRCAVETGARFLLDPRRKHQPTLVSAAAGDRARRLDFLKRSIDVAARLGADAVSFWSGAADDRAPDKVLITRLADGCRALADEAAARGVRLAFEPEPGMVVDTMKRYAKLAAAVGHPAFGLTVDVGHLHCQGEGPIPAVLKKWKHVLWNVHIEDMRRGVHDHLMFGEGEIDFPPVLAALREVGYAGGAYVELSRHSHDAVNAAKRSIAFLRANGA